MRGSTRLTRREAELWHSAALLLVALAFGCSGERDAADGGGSTAPPRGGSGGAASPGGSGGAGGSASTDAGGAGAAASGSDAGGGGEHGGNDADASTRLDDAATGDAALPGAYESREIAAPPTYAGTVDNGAACNRDYTSYGFEPSGGADARYPLFLYFSGTNFVTDPETFRRDVAQAARVVTEAMARHGFVALAVDYDNGALAWLSDHVNQLRCLFAMEEPRSVLATACGLPNVDCELGIATWGHSQGGYVAHAAANLDARIRAVWTAGYGGNEQVTLAKNRLRVVNGEGDVTNSDVATLNRITGLTTAECPDDGRKHCLRDDGSGWIVVQAADCQVSSADHCWFDKVTCTDAAVMLEPNWIDPGSTKPFALELNADWVAETLRRP